MKISDCTLHLYLELTAKLTKNTKRQPSWNLYEPHDFMVRQAVMNHPDL